MPNRRVCVYSMLEIRVPFPAPRKREKKPKICSKGFVTLRKLGAGEMVQQLEHLFLQRIWGKFKKKKQNKLTSRVASLGHV